MMKSAHNSHLIYLYGIDEAWEHHHEILGQLFLFLNHESAWGGPSKQESKDYVPSVRSWEIINSKADKVFEKTQVFLDVKRLDYSIGYPDL